ncbi:choline/ethanolamine kinase [Angomonas deanei]|uniref:ethanolamine kinase n=1 Tax=Angomonas deanei TaxID=59799 RepID=A0A7G2C9C4_9TRYP|nr:choline/ethanolamine kinase [Angomonas deanei]CAD2215467.1 Choline/ethanolamine kinase/Phosphotransferase enzyme family, putative [Angomonas deanei]|eukprot:EPY36410.1 choline/ethanolamine kinase [Angomonas deanei]
MPNEMEKIADKMAALQVRATVASKEDVNASGASRFSLEENYTVKSLNDWVNQIASAEIQEKVQDQKRASFIDLGARMQVESEAMRAMIEAHVDQLVEGVCHNDLLCANLMLNEAKKELVIIDFDYTKRNFLLFDIANHFNEYTGLKCDYDTYFPSDSHMRNFITIYREAMRRYILEAHQEQTTLTEVFEGERNFFFTTCEEEEAQVITEWVKLVKWMTLLSNLSWAIWSLFQEAVSDLDVDFLNYAGQRFDRYVLTKQAFLDDIFPNS